MCIWQVCVGSESQCTSRNKTNSFFRKKNSTEEWNEKQNKLLFLFFYYLLCSTFFVVSLLLSLPISFQRPLIHSDSVRVGKNHAIHLFRWYSFCRAVHGMNDDSRNCSRLYILSSSFSAQLLCMCKTISIRVNERNLSVLLLFILEREVEKLITKRNENENVVIWTLAFTICWAIARLCGNEYWALHGWMYRYKLKPKCVESMWKSRRIPKLNHTTYTHRWIDVYCTNSFCSLTDARTAAAAGAAVVDVVVFPFIASKSLCERKSKWMRKTKTDRRRERERERKKEIFSSCYFGTWNKAKWRRQNEHDRRSNICCIVWMNTAQRTCARRRSII